MEKARLLRISQGLNLVWARNAHMLAIPELNWCLEPRTSAGRNVTWRRSSANPRRSKKLIEMRSASLLHKLRSAMKPLSLLEPGSSHRRKISWYHTRQPPSRLAAWAALRLLKSQCDGSGESRQKARRKLERGLMPNEQVMADAKRAFQCALFFP